MKKVFCCLVLLCAMPLTLYARPVSYPGGYTVMTKNSVDTNSMHLHYSPTARYSIGYRGEYWRGDQYYLHSLAANYLLHRNNMPESQANMYLKSGLGIAYSDYEDFDSEYQPLAYGGLATDWEDRRFFVSHEFRLLYADQIDKSFHQTGRIGLAPYVGEYGDLHTWIMLEVGHHPGSEDSYSITPLIRFFKDVYLLEVGVSVDGDVMVNGIIRY